MRGSRVGLIDIALLTSVKEMVTGLLNALGIGDQVPELPIRDKDTYEKILQNIRDNFPDPVSVDNARQLYDKAKQWEKIAYDKAEEKRLIGKNPAVDESYGIMYGKTAQVYMNYISYADEPGPAGESTDFPAPSTPKQGMIGGGALLLGLGLLLITGMGKVRKNRR